MAIRWSQYNNKGSYDEMVGPRKTPRPAALHVANYLRSLKDSELDERRTAAEMSIRAMGVTFTVYNQDGGAIDRAWPFDIIPRIFEKKEWARLEAGLQQRVRALNLFIDDIYNEQRIIHDGIFPAELLKGSANFRPQCVGFSPRFKVWANICGSDLVRDKDGTMYVLEDNLRVPSGVSYMMENRLVMKRVFPELFEQVSIEPVDNYPSQLYDMLASLSPRPGDEPEIVVLSPGIYNSAYFEHAYLAQQMGAELVLGSDLVVKEDDKVYMRAVGGLRQVDVIYRRIDDLFLDPEAFNPDSALGVSGLMRSWKAGKVALANAPGAGMADDKVVYAIVPDMIRYYLDAQPILDNVPTYLCMRPKERSFVLANLDKLVVKPANESGGYGMLIGPHSTSSEREKMAAQIRRNPRNFIAQPTLSLSTVPTLVDHGAEPRHVDLRPFVLSGDSIQTTTGGLTRVALKRGSLVVNSSQGGGSKDTWIVDVEDQ